MKVLLLLLLFFAHILMSYNGSVFPLCALLGSALIMVIARAIWPEDWKDWLGLRIGARDAVLAIVITPMLMALLYGMIRSIANAQDILYQPPIVKHGIIAPIYLHTLGQTLNEEMLFGALLLTALRGRFPRGRSLYIAGIVAFCFSLLHYVFYRWIVLPNYSGILTLGALFVLFAIGISRNTLILKAGHIAFAWSLHLSINIVGLLGFYQFESGYKLSEPQVFIHILGSQNAVIMSAFVLMICCIILWPVKEKLYQTS
jgi:hypothetical protein